MGQHEFCFRATRPKGCVGGAPDIVIIHNVHKSGFIEDSVQGASLRSTLPRGKWLATHGRVNSIEDTQTLDIRHPVHGDRIADVKDPAIRVGERRP